MENNKDKALLSTINKVFEYLEFIELDQNFILYKDLELYNTETKKSIQFDTLEQAFEYEIQNRKLKDLINEITFNFVYKGGRGAGSMQLGGGFSDSMGSNGRTISLFPSQLNRGGRYTNQESTIQNFTKLYKNANREYGASIAEDGFVYQHVQGSKHSVSIGAYGKNHMVIHNHPSGSNFSKADMLSTSKDNKSNGIIAVGSKNTYIMRKTKNFNAKEFSKAVSEAKWPKKYDYNEGAHWWLKKNANKYGFEYERRRTIN